MIYKTNKAYITTTSVSCCAGNSELELFSNICEGISGIETDPTYFNETPAAIGKIQLNLNFFDNLIDKCDEVLSKSNLENFDDTLLVIGSSVGGINLTESLYFKEGDYKNIDPNYHNINTIQNILEQKFRFKDGI